MNKQAKNNPKEAGRDQSLLPIDNCNMFNSSEDLLQHPSTSVTAGSKLNQNYNSQSSLPISYNFIQVIQKQNPSQTICNSVSSSSTAGQTGFSKMKSAAQVKT